MSVKVRSQRMSSTTIKEENKYDDKSGVQIDLIALAKLENFRDREL
jgi:hypothetical protein